LTVNNTLNVKIIIDSGLRIASFPTTNTGSKAGHSKYRNIVSGTGYTCFLNYAQAGPGGFSFYTANHKNIPRLIASLDYQANLSNLNILSCNIITLGLNSLTSTLLEFLSTISSNVQTQFDNINTTITTLQTTSISSTLLGYLSTITSNVQTQINDLNTTISTLYFVPSGLSLPTTTFTGAGLKYFGMLLVVQE